MILNFIFSIVSVLIIAKILPGVQLTGAGPAVLVVVVMGLCNLIIRPILIFLTLPITIITLGLFLFIINIIIVYMVSGLVPGFKVDGMMTAFLFSILYSVFNSVFSNLLEKRKED